MALCRAVDLTLKSVLVNPCFIVPSSVNLQVRHAGRKGYREEKRRQKKAEKLKMAAVLPKEFNVSKAKSIRIDQTFDLKKPEPPDDDVFIRDNFNHKRFSLEEIITFHREYHHPTVYNNPDAPVFLRIEINMIGKKQTQFLKPFSGIAAMPHPFVFKHRKEIIVFCSPEDEELALKCGASIAGTTDLVKKIQEGVVQPSLYNYIVAHTNVLPQLIPIRGLLKDQMPRAKIGTLTNNLESAIHRFLHGIEYSCERVGSKNDFGVIQCCIGTLDMELEHIESNFKALIEDIEKKRPPRDGKFITWIWCLSPPSPEKFLIDLSEYVDTTKLEPGDEDDDDDVKEVKESEAIRALKVEYEEQTLMN